MSSGKPLRICHLGKYYPPAPGGIETHVQTLARAQAALGAQVRVLCVNHTNDKGDDVTWSRTGATRTVCESDNGVDVLRLGRSAHFAKLDVVPDLRWAFRQFKTDAVDVIHLHTPNPTMLLAVAALRPWAPLVITHHSDIVKQRKLYQVFAPFERAVYARAATLVSDSPTYIDGSDVLQSYRHKVESLPLGLDLTDFSHPSPQAQGVAVQIRAEHGPVLWLGVGRLVYYKGFDTAIRALQHVPGKLIIIGRGPFQEGLASLAKSLGVQDRLIWWGHANRDQLVGCYHAAAALWFPSVLRSEGFGLVQLEAMASGCPVINTAIPHSGVAWVSRHGETGLTVPVGNPIALADAARRLLAESGLRERLGRAARTRAVERFGEKTMAVRSLELYGRALDGPKPQRRPEFGPGSRERVRRVQRQREDVQPLLSEPECVLGVD